MVMVAMTMTVQDNAERKENILVIFTLPINVKKQPEHTRDGKVKTENPESPNTN